MLVKLKRFMEESIGLKAILQHCISEAAATDFPNILTTWDIVI